MAVYNYPPENRNAVIRRRLENGPMDPPEAKVIGEWSYVGGGKVFRLIEAEAAHVFLASAKGWADLGQIEIYPVMQTEEVLRLMD